MSYGSGRRVSRLGGPRAHHGGLNPQSGLHGAERLIHRDRTGRESNPGPLEDALGAGHAQDGESYADAAASLALGELTAGAAIVRAAGSPCIAVEKGLDFRRVSRARRMRQGCTDNSWFHRGVEPAAVLRNRRKSSDSAADNCRNSDSRPMRDATRKSVPKRMKPSVSASIDSISVRSPAGIVCQGLS